MKALRVSESDGDRKDERHSDKETPSVFSTWSTTTTTTARELKEGPFSLQLSVITLESLCPWLFSLIDPLMNERVMIEGNFLYDVVFMGCWGVFEDREEEEEIGIALKTQKQQVKTARRTKRGKRIQSSNGL